MDETNLSIWQTKASDLTVADQMKVGLGAAAIGALVMVTVPLAIGGVVSVIDKIRTERRIKKEVKTLETV